MNRVTAWRSLRGASVHLSVHLSIRLSVHLGVRLSDH